MPQSVSEAVSESVAKPSLSTRLLLLFCHEPKPVPMVHYDGGSALDNLLAVFPNFGEEIRGKRVVDLGCGMGYQAVAMLRAGAAWVTAIEVNGDLAAKAQARLEAEGLSSRARVTDSLKGESADVIVSQNSFEHFQDAEAMLSAMRAALAPGGRILLTFGPLWYAPLGSHMSFFCRLPWVNLLFPERAVMMARARYRQDGMRTYTEAGLAKMSLAKFERTMAAAGVTVEWRRYDCVKRMVFLAHVPLLRELFVNRVSCVLRDAAPGAGAGVRFGAERSV